MHPATSRGAAKACAALWLQQYAGSTGFPAVELRVFSVYGIGEGPHRFIPTLLRAAITGEVMPLVAGPRHDFIYVEDVVDACLCAARVATARWRGVQHRQRCFSDKRRGSRDRAKGDRAADSDRRNALSQQPGGPGILVRRYLRGARAPGVDAAPLAARGTRCNVRMDAAGRMNGISVVLPVYRNAEALAALHARLIRALEAEAAELELILRGRRLPRRFRRGAGRVGAAGRARADHPA